MSDALVAHGVKTIRQRALAEGGFANCAGGAFRGDATAWAIVALVAAGEVQDNELIRLGRSRLAASQLPDGRLALAADHPEVYWPTSLALLAWQHSPAHQERLSRAAHFLLSHSGTHWQTKDGEDLHDHSLRGWPWVDNTYSWIAPTALGIMALKITGYGDQPRISEGQRLILARECLHGGWNYGNRFLFGAELRPMPEDTGMALNALEGATTRPAMTRSLEYLKTAVQDLRTPTALAWSLWGLGAWGERPAAAGGMLWECWRRQERFGTYDTTSLALLVGTALATAGLESLFPAPAAPKG